MAWNVFYAWQSDRPANANKNLILTALEAAIEQVRTEGSVVVDPRLDRDTLGVPGSPDIVATIFEKIDAAAVFVADVTLVTPADSDRPAPNPNVLIELGYALRALGPSRVITVMNTVYGMPDDLPFDIRQKRTLTYELAAEAPEKAPGRRQLQQTLVQAIRMGLEAFEQTRPKPLPEQSVADALIAAIEQRSPAQRSLARRYVHTTLSELDSLRPVDVGADESLVTALQATASVVATFARVAQVLAAYQATDPLEEVLRIFEQLLRHYDLPPGFAGSSRNSDFDFFKFLGHEMFVVLVAAYLREEQWEALDRLLRTPLSVTGSSRPDRITSFDDISRYTALLDEERRDRLRSGNSVPLSVHADILKERYSRGALAEAVSWDLFRAADFFLYARCHVEAGSVQNRVWRPWTVFYLRALPEFVQRAESRSYASRVATGLGLKDVQALADGLKNAVADLRNFHRSAFWDPPGERFEWSRIASR